MCNTKLSLPYKPSVVRGRLHPPYFERERQGASQNLVALDSIAHLLSGSPKVSSPLTTKIRAEEQSLGLRDTVRNLKLSTIDSSYQLFILLLLTCVFIFIERNYTRINQAISSFPVSKSHEE